MKAEISADAEVDRPIAPPISRRLANALGILTILAWGSLGLLGKEASSLPPFFVLAVCFAGATAIGMALIVAMPQPVGGKPVMSFKEVSIGGAFLFIYHFLYFLAFHHAPAVEVSLLNYLWPAFVIIIGNMFFALGSGIRGFVAAAIGFLGIIVLFGADPVAFVDSGNLFGFGLALAGAVVWATYSNLRRKGQGDVLRTVAAICGMAALLAIGFSAATEKIPTLSAIHLWTLALLTIGPAGGVFFLWDIALKNGDAAWLAVLGYAAPVVSTALLIAAGYADPSIRTVAATALIALGGVASAGSSTSTSDKPSMG